MGAAGLSGRIRLVAAATTPPALSDPRSPDQRPIAGYDLKTGNAILTRKREAQLRQKLGQRYDLPIIVLEYKTGNAIFPRR